MMKKVFLILFVGVLGVLVGQQVRETSTPVNDVLLANVEALADAETSDEFTSATDCVAVWEYVTCRSSITGKLYSFAQKV